MNKALKCWKETKVEYANANNIYFTHKEDKKHSGYETVHIYELEDKKNASILERNPKIWVIKYPNDSIKKVKTKSEALKLAESYMAKDCK